MALTGRALPEGRYGTRRARISRRTSWIIGGLALVFGVTATYLAYINLGAAPIETQRTSFQNLPGKAMRLTFDVVRDQPARPAVCIVRVRALDGAEGGRREVLIPPGGSATSVSTVIRSTTEPVTAEVFGCSYQIPAYLSTPTPPSG